MKNIFRNAIIFINIAHGYKLVTNVGAGLISAK